MEAYKAEERRDGELLPLCSGLFVLVWGCSPSLNGWHEWAWELCCGLFALFNVHGVEELLPQLRET